MSNVTNSTRQSAYLNDPEESNGFVNLAPWIWGESKNRNLSEMFVWAVSARGFNDMCLTGAPVSVWWCAFRAMEGATNAPMAFR